MDVFKLRDQLISDYGSYSSSFINILDDHIREHVEQEINEGLLWPDPLIQLNPSFQQGASIDELVNERFLHEECGNIFRVGKTKDLANRGNPLRLHFHQEQAIRTSAQQKNYVLTTGTGSGKSLAYIIPIVDHVLRHGSGKGIQAIIVYPMNALVNSQLGELERFLQFGYPDQRGPVTFERYTGQESDEDRNRIMGNPPDILLTNYVMLELMLTRPKERKNLIRSAQGMRFLVLDELHTYRGRQGADVAMLVRRVREATQSPDLQCVGTSATLAGEGTYVQKQADVAAVASRIFGSEVTPDRVIGETLERSTPELDFGDRDVIERIRQQIERQDPAPRGYQDYASHPLSAWLETAFGLENESESGRLVRRVPRGVWGEDGAAQELAHLLGLDRESCGRAIEAWLLASYQADPNPETGFPIFAFRLHQFISRGDTAYSTFEYEDDRYITVNKQQFVPGDRSRLLYPVVFCRECGQEYYSVYADSAGDAGPKTFKPREFNEHRTDQGGEPGYLYISSSKPWPEVDDEILERLPDEWLEDTGNGFVVRRNRRKDLPQTIRVDAVGQEGDSGVTAQWVQAPFRFCLNCGAAYGFRQYSDFPKLATLGVGGRSTATTILSLSTIRSIMKEGSLPKRARKLLSFTDNRQDASLQSGHFNDFIQVGVLRAGLYHAAMAAGDRGIEHAELAQKVADALDLDFDLYAADPDVRFRAKEDTEAAFREVLAYRLYNDLRRGWRVTSPNLEQCGLLNIHYKSLDEICASDPDWHRAHPVLATSTYEERERISKVLLDFMRRELAIKVDFLEANHQERIQQRSSQRLRQPWAIDEDERMTSASVLFPRSRQSGDYGGHVFLSSRSGFGQYLRKITFENYKEKLSLEETGEIIEQILGILRVAGLVEVVAPLRGSGDVPGYQLPAAAMIWLAGDGSTAFHDPIRMPGLPEGGGRTNPFFVDFYKSVAGDLVEIEAREHTAQVPYAWREEREEAFRSGDLPILFCSPTMELGVDIAQLNVVNLRNVPPTPANYAQRSGRAGRSGQPALVFTYCSTGSSHDQYFFKRPERMVAGAVSPPRIDLANEELIRAHVHAIWLAETGLDLEKSLKDLLNLSGNPPGLDLLPRVRDSLGHPAAIQRAGDSARRVLATVHDDIVDSGWYSSRWLDDVFEHVMLEFDQACKRWRDLYRSALKQRDIQHKVITDASRSQVDKNRARMLRGEAERQIELLTEVGRVAQSDFYSYRYFASEGFLPGYNFPRLPISAFIPGRHLRAVKDEFLNRPRFLAISEFGPRAFVYHEGSRYIIHRVMLPVESDEDGSFTSLAKQCAVCGYLHPIHEGEGPDLCAYCGAALGPPMRNLFRMQNVSTKRRDRINSDEEERLRQGFELRSGVRFPQSSSGLECVIGDVKRGSDPIAKLTYANAATIWRINMGWRRRDSENEHGFLLDMEKGYWASKKQAEEEDPADPMGPKVERVIPYVEDTKNCLIFEPVAQLDQTQMASLQAALKNAIQVAYQLEDSELAAEPLPDRAERRSILFYEASEGGAGVLKQLMEDPGAFAEVARAALEICHFDTATGRDLGKAPRAKELCEAACYDCLMNYSNQLDHELLDRKTIQPLLLTYAQAVVSHGPVSVSRAEHLERLKNLAESDLEMKWLDFLEMHNLHLPTHAQKAFSVCSTRPDFYYEQDFAAIYIDGPHHAYPERHQRDVEARTCMEDQGYTVIRFGVLEDWDAIVKRYPAIFGSLA